MKKIAIVTGGAKGLGETISQDLVNKGYKVYVCSRNPGKSKGGIIATKIDISKQAQCKKLITTVAKIEKRLDLLVNNAGINDSKNIKKTFDVNVFGAYYMINAAKPLLQKSSGRIVNITSLNGVVPTPESAVYSASKHAIEGLGIALAYEFANDGVSITNVAPGAIYNPDSKALSHMALREKYWILRKLFPMTTREMVSGKVMESVLTSNPPKRLVVGIDAKIAYMLSRHVPNFWFWLVQKLYS